MKKLLTYFTFTIFISYYSPAQIVMLDPVGAGAEEEATLIFDATQGNAELVGANKVYLHHGVVISGPEGTDWNHVIGNWGQDDGVGQMTPVAGETDKWQITFSPTIREYFDVPANENIFRISAVFRNADGSIKGTIDAGEYGWGTVASNLDFYINLNASAYISINYPSGNESFIEPGEPVSIEATASDEVTSMKIWIDEGDGYEEMASVSSGTSISFDYSPESSVEISLKVTATIDNEEIEALKTIRVVVVQPAVVEEIPEGLIDGINYGDDSVTLILNAPYKDFVFLIGDFNNWDLLDDYQMKKTPDNKRYWFTVTDLNPDTEYRFQYYVDGEIKIADPYVNKILDPWNDEYIPGSIYPNLIDYPSEYTTEIVGVFQINREQFEWEITDFEAPDVEDLVIYELLIRDFTGNSDIKTITDTLDYLENLGVNAIEIMPFNEFEGNDSWGYNPSFYFATDKAYGTDHDYKTFIDECHKRGIAVIMDMVLNHSYGQSPFLRLYMDNWQPTAENPWYNEECPHQPWCWGADFNHESQLVKDLVDRINTYWITEFKIDGYRFDFTKGFTNTVGDGWNYDASRIANLKRMADVIWTVNPDAYVILEHLTANTEEKELAEYGMLLWGNMNHNYNEATMGYNDGLI